MKSIIITGSGGLVGSEAARFFHGKGFQVLGVDNDKRSYFFGASASTKWKVDQLQKELPHYIHFNQDIGDLAFWENVIFPKYKTDLQLILHCAAQPSHDWASQEPLTDFDINATSTLKLLECTRKYAPHAVFIFTSTNKVYGDGPNHLPLLEHEKRWELDSQHHFAAKGITESMTVDHTLHSIFGVSKTAADLMVQEYGRYFGLKTIVFRGGCLTGPAHSGAALHGFLAYLVQCAVKQKSYTIFGHKGKQVRDNIHSHDLVNAFWEAFQSPPTPGEVFNIGGSRHSNISMMEAIHWLENKLGREMDYQIDHDKARKGDHIWYISDVSKFQAQYPNWKYQYNIEDILDEMVTTALKGKI
ncbi:MAG: NAD-dependent epimerase/dehydratase family protein [Sphingobacteriales bacterium]|jgi:CDP-paratose 2-epimerase